MCNARIIWGGDNSISNIRKFGLNQRALDIAFADRYSFCAMNASEILKISKDLFATYKIRKRIHYKIAYNITHLETVVQLYSTIHL